MGTSYNPKIVTDGLVLCLDAANPKSYPGSGTIWTNLRNNDSSSTLFNSPVFDSTNGGSFIFDGVNDYAEYTPYEKDNTFINRSLSAWFMCLGSSPNNQQQGIVCIFDNNYGNPPFQLDVNIAGTTVNTSIFYDATVKSTGVSISSNLWYNVVGVENHDNGSKIQIYINGRLENETTISGTSYTTTATNISIGSQKRSSFNRYFNGKISNVAVYDKSLSVEEIQQNFNALRGRYGI